MSRSIHLFLKSIPGYGTPEGRCHPPFSGKRAVGMSPHSSRGDYTLFSDVKFLSLRHGSRPTSYVCNASASNYRRKQDLSRQNKHGFSRNRNRNNDDLDGYEDDEESVALTSKNGPLVSVSGSQKSQSSIPGHREREIIELFRKVQVQLRERAAVKEERKFEESKGKNKESETVDSLLKLLRKHSVQQGKKNANGARNVDFILGQTEQVVPPIKENATNTWNSSRSVKHGTQESPRPNTTRPKSNFRKRSPVPEIKFMPVYSEGSINSTSRDMKKGISLEPEADDIDELKIESDVEASFSEGSMYDEMPEDETSEIYESEHNIGADEDSSVQASNLSEMKLAELRALAKSRGMKRYSKMKKTDLIELLSGSSI